jgi:hypothetical protein
MLGTGGNVVLIEDENVQLTLGRAGVRRDVTGDAAPCRGDIVGARAFDTLKQDDRPGGRAIDDSQLVGAQIRQRSAGRVDDLDVEADQVDAGPEHRTRRRRLLCRKWSEPE